MQRLVRDTPQIAAASEYRLDAAERWPQGPTGQEKETGV